MFTTNKKVDEKTWRNKGKKTSIKRLISDLKGNKSKSVFVKCINRDVFD